MSDGPNNPPPPGNEGGAPPPPQPTPPQAPPADPNAGGGGGGGGGGSTATLGVRFVAKLLDGLIVGIPLAIVLSIAGVNTLSYVYTLVQAVVYIGYLSYLESTSGQTIGKKIMNLTVVDEAGNPPSLEAAVKRNAWAALGIIPILGGIAQLAAVIAIAVTISSDQFNRGFHDKFADTGVMRTG